MIKRIFLAFLVAACLLLSSCQAVQSGSEASAPASEAETLVAPSAIAADFAQTMADIGAGKYPNLSGTVNSPQPEVTEVVTVELVVEDRYSTFEEFADAAEDFFGQFQEYKPELVLVPVTDEQTGETTMASLAKIRQNGTEAAYTDAQAFLFRGVYLAGEMQFPRNLIPLWTNRGGIAALNSELWPHPGIQTYGGTVYDFRTGASTDTTVTLAGQTVSFADAIAVFDREINQNYFLPDPNPDLTYQVHSIVVCDITDSVQALKLMCRPVYHGIPFDEFYGEGGTAKDVPDMDSYNMTAIGLANAMMLSPDTLDTTVNISRVRRTIPGTPIRQMLPVSAAVQMVSDQLTTATTFPVECAELVYIAAPESKADADSVTMCPAWKLRLINPNNNARYSYYVDVVTGAMTATEEPS